MTVRHPAVAGMFYPADPDQLVSDLRHLLATADVVEADFAVKILVVPHAGYIYSGPIAATAYRLLAEVEGLRRIVMLGPSHFVPTSRLELPGVDALSTPLGTVEVDVGAAAEALRHRLVGESRDVHRREHSLEVQLPFLQIVTPGVPVLPLLTGSVDPVAAADIVETLMDGTSLLLVSSDLSHYLDAAAARRLDGETVAAMRRLDPDALGRESACGRTGVQIALHIARRRGYRVAVLDLRNSADTAGTPDRVVGYCAVALGA